MLTDVNILSVLLAFVPALMNMAILVYLLFFMPRDKRTDIFLMIVLALILWQLEDTLLRLNITEDAALFVDKIFSMFWLSIGPLILHFAGVYAGKKWVDTRKGLFLLYGPGIVFYTLYHANPTPINITHDAFWGYIIEIRPGTLDIFQRIWVLGMVLMAVVLLFKTGRRAPKGSDQRKQTIIISLGIIIPAVQAGVTQVLFHILSLPELPLATTFMTFFSVSVWMALRKYRLFDISSSMNLRTVMHHMPNMVLAVSQEKEIMYANPNAKSLFGEELPVQKLRLDKLFEEKKDYLKFCKEILEPAFQGKRTENHEVKFIGHMGRRVHVLLTVQPILNNLKIRGVLLVANDISQRKAAEEAVRVSNDRYHLVTKATNEAIWDWDLSDNTMRWGVGYQQLFGYSVGEEGTGFSHWEERVHPEDLPRVMESLFKHIHNNHTRRWEEEYRYQKQDGTFAHVLNKGYILRDEDGKAFRMVGAKEDITQMKTYISKIEQQNRDLSEIAWVQSHVVRAPLARMMGLVNCLQWLDMNEEERNEILKNLSRSFDELDQIIREIVVKTERLNK